RRFTLSTKPGRMRGDFRVTISRINDPIATVVRSAPTANLGDYLYLCLGSKLDALAEALVAKEKLAAEEKNTQFRQSRFAVFQDGVVGEYDGVDLVILNTGAAGIWGTDVQTELPSLLKWVRRGGRLVVGVNPDCADVLANFVRGQNEGLARRPPFLA